MKPAGSLSVYTFITVSHIEKIIFLMIILEKKNAGTREGTKAEMSSSHNHYNGMLSKRAEIAFYRKTGNGKSTE